MPTEKIELPEQEIIDTYKKGVWWTISRVAKKFETTEYRVRKILVKANALRNTGDLEKLMIKTLLKYERQFSQESVGREIMIARRLIQDYPEEDFWRNLNLGFQLNSLAFLNSERGVEMLKKKYGQFKFEIPVVAQHNMQTEKVGEDLEVVSKPKSIHDFMKR